MSGSPSLHDKLHRLSEVIALAAVSQLQRRKDAFEVHLPTTIQDTYKLWTDRVASRQRLLRTIIWDWRVIKVEHEKRNEVCGHLFNPLALIPICENVHSRLLGDLLNPRGSHGQGRLFLHAFLTRLDVPNPEKGEWTVSVGEAWIDLCLRRRSPASVIIIENKSNWAVDQSNQLYRYWYEHIHRPHAPLDYSLPDTKRAFQVIYLPPAGGKEPEPHSLQRPPYLADHDLPKSLQEAGVTFEILTFRDFITDWLKQCDQAVPATNTRLKAYLQFYQELWN